MCSLYAATVAAGGAGLGTPANMVLKGGTNDRCDGTTCAAGASDIANCFEERAMCSLYAATVAAGGAGLGTPANMVLKGGNNNRCVGATCTTSDAAICFENRAMCSTIENTDIQKGYIRKSGYCNGISCSTNDTTFSLEPDEILCFQECPVGQVPNTTRDECEPCDAGEYTFTPAQALAVGAVAGTCLQCPAGYTCVNGIKSQCPKGQYLVNGTCRECPEGKYWNNAAKGTCNLYEKCLNINSANVVSIGNCTDTNSDWYNYPHYQSDNKDPLNTYPSFTNYKRGTRWLRNETAITSSTTSADFSKSTWKYSTDLPTDPTDNPPCNSCTVDHSSHAATRKGPGMLSNGPQGWEQCIGVKVPKYGDAPNTHAETDVVDDGSTLDTQLRSRVCDRGGAHMNVAVPWFKEIVSGSAKKIMMCRVGAEQGEHGYCVNYNGPDSW
tara:strand:+ start:239 stop:1558 length:1320 start_codon:yes stop_codon:yes gene_type:complete